MEAFYPLLSQFQRTVVHLFNVLNCITWRRTFYIRFVNYYYLQF